MKTAISKRILCLILVFTMLMGAVPAMAASRPNVHATSAIVMDYETGDILYAKNADVMRPPASMTKIMTAYIIFEELEAGRLTPDTMVPISNNAADKSRDSRYPSRVPLPYGGKVSVDNLIKLILIPSASASCIAMAEYISGNEQAFVNRMNQTAARLGMKAEFRNCHGAIPHNTNARSIAILIRNFIQRFPQILNYTSMKTMQFEGRTIKNTNGLLGQYYYSGCDGFKTGTIPEAGYCLSVTAKRNGHRIIAVLMNSDNNVHRHTDAIELLDFGFSHINSNSQYFRDIGTHWARTEIEEISKTGIALHTRNGYFRPDAPITRAEFTAMLVTALEPRGILDSIPAEETPAFTDINNCWAKAEILRAASRGLVSGRAEGSFEPEAALTREEAMTILDRALALPEAPASSAPDRSSVSDWAAASADRTVAYGLFRGDDHGRLNPHSQLKRAESVSIFHSLISKTA